MDLEKRTKKGVSSKKGQTTGLIIVGIVVLVVLFLALSLKDRIWFGPVTPDTLGERVEPIQDHIQNCIEDVGGDHIERIGLQGGYLAVPQGSFRHYQSVPISYLCYNMEDTSQCMNRALTIGHMEDELEEAISTGLLSCIDFGKFMKRGFDLTVGTREVEVLIGRSSTSVTVKQPLTLKKKDVTVNEDKFTFVFDVPLGRLYEVSQDIVTAEATEGMFEQLSYMLSHKGEYIIDKKKPYPDTLYMLNTKDSEYVFQFFIQGEPSN